MRLPTRTPGLAALAALAAAVVLTRPDTEAAAQPAAADLPADLALVPADAVGFLHVRAADLWKHDLFADFRKTVEKAGPKALAALDAQFVPKVSTFDRATGFVLMDAERDRPVPFLALRFTQPFDRDAVVKAYLPQAKKVTANGKVVYGNEEAGIALTFPDDRYIVLGPTRGFEAYVKSTGAKTGPLAHGLKLAAAGKPVVVAVNLSAIPPDVIRDVLRDFRSLPPEALALLKAEHLTLSADLAGDVHLDLTAGYKSADDAKAAEMAVKALADLGRKELAKLKADVEKELFGAKGPRPVGDLPGALLSVAALGAINTADEWLADPGKYVKRDGSALTARVTLPKELVASVAPAAAVGVAMLLPAVQKVREAAARAQSQNNLKQIALAVHNYHDTFGHFPQDIVDRNGKPILSWRVAILPFIEQENLYRQFKMDEPWDGPNNKKLSMTVIKTYLSPNAPPAPVGPNIPGMTHYQAFVGKGTVFEFGKKIKITDVLDGTSNTIMAVETAEAVPWAMPGGLSFDPKDKEGPKLQPVGPNGLVNVAMCDGSVRALKVTIDGKSLKALITRDGGEVVDLDP